ncbi:MAG: GNAT family N-acetyltransferase [Bacteriovoracaceae bacterium]|nr:GNAT family N-acetyltransferase [Bacteriovoracaceae bacterium]
MGNTSTIIEFSDLRSKMDFDFIYHFLTNSYWSEGISQERMLRAMDNSINIGAFIEGKQVAYSRVVTDKSTYAYLCDVFVSPSTRGKNISKKMMEYILSMDSLQGIKRFSLCTKDAHGLYAQFGWKPLVDPEMYMEINRSGIYKLLNE